MPQYEAVYTYYPNRNLVDTIAYGNRTSIEYDYDDADRVDFIRHRSNGGTDFLVLDYEYDARGRIDRITETEGGVTTEVDYSYDDRGRLTGEKRCTPDCTAPIHTTYNLEYHYDQGGNRLYKWDWVNNLVTDYEYDPGNNRLTGYEVRVIGTTDVVERVVYDYFHADDKAGNVRRVARKVADVPGPDPWSWTVYGTDFDYHRNGEVRMIIQRTWRDEGGAVSDDQLVSIHEVRGNGRTRYMLRPWGFAPDGQGGWNTWADNAAALWTVYDGDEPTTDYRMIDHPTLGLVPYPENSYTLGLAQRTPDGDVKYFHTDHLGTTQAMTGAAQEVDPRIVYTAFGEVIDMLGTVDTRYQYAGRDGYEAFAALPFTHLGYRWYDASCGRFLQRDRLGIDGGLNVYLYVRGNPVLSTDPAGLYYAPTQPPWSGEAFKQYIVVGIVTGAGTGALAGGIGAGPGAVGGGALGGISYAIDHTVNAVYVTCSDIIEAMRDLGEAKDRNSKKRRQNPELFPPRPLPPYNEWPCKGPASHY